MTHEHLSDEQLSAHLDGEAPEASSAASAESLEAQIAACEACRQRLTALSGVRDLLRLPVESVPPSVRAAAVETALAEGLADLQDRRSKTTGAAVAPIRATRRAGPPRVLVGAAAAVAVLVVAVGLSLGLAHSGTPSASSAARAPVPEPATSSPLGPTAASPSTGLAALGSLASPETLIRRLAPLLPPAKVTSGSAASGPEAASNSDDFATGTRGAPGISGTAAVPAALSPCVAATQRASDASGTVILVATAIYRQTPALVVVFQAVGTASTQNGRVAVVVARSGCRVLVRTTL
jgi:anti-sigma factor RsiW